MTRAQTVALARYRRRSVPQARSLPAWCESERYSGSLEHFWKGIFDEMMESVLAAPDLSRLSKQNV